MPIRTVDHSQKTVRKRLSVGALVLIGLVQILVIAGVVNASVPLQNRPRDEKPQPQPDLAAASNYTAAERQQALTDAIDEFRTKNGNIDVSLAVASGNVELTYGNDTTMETASAVKLEILVRWLLLHQDDDLPQGELQLARDMITNSDNNATSALCARISSSTEPDIVPGGTNACVGTGMWGTDETTAVDALQVVDVAYGDELLNRESRSLVWELTGSITSEQAWGISSAAHQGEQVYLKNGWDIRDEGWVAHSLGVIDDERPLRIAIFTDKNDDFDSGVTHVERLAELARQAAQGAPG